jgi:Domain of unknown function DUF29
MTETTHSQPSLSTLYESDFYAWTQEQVKLLNEGKWADVDLVNVIEEIDSLGKQQRQELENRLGVLLGHLLKWQFQPDQRSKSWSATIREQRYKVRKHIRKNLSLKPYIPEAMQEGYESGVNLAVIETLLDYAVFPSVCSYSFEEAIDDQFFPD